MRALISLGLPAPRTLPGDPFGMLVDAARTWLTGKKRTFRFPEGDLTLVLEDIAVEGSDLARIIGQGSTSKPGQPSSSVGDPLDQPQRRRGSMQDRGEQGRQQGCGDLVAQVGQKAGDANARHAPAEPALAAGFAKPGLSHHRRQLYGVEHPQQVDQAVTHTCHAHRELPYLSAGRRFAQPQRPLTRDPRG